MKMADGDIIQVYEDGTVKVQASIEQHEYEDGKYEFRYVDICGAEMPIEELQDAHEKDGNIYTLMGRYDQHICDEPLTQKKFDEILKAAGCFHTPLNPNGIMILDYLKPGVYYHLSSPLK